VKLSDIAIQRLGTSVQLELVHVEKQFEFYIPPKIFGDDRRWMDALLLLLGVETSIENQQCMDTIVQQLTRMEFMSRVLLESM
jgi:hypothetical protein